MIQPIGFLGVLEARIAPTVEYPRIVRKSTGRNTRSSVANPPSGPPPRMYSVIATTISSVASPHRSHGQRRPHGLLTHGLLPHGRLP